MAKILIIDDEESIRKSIKEVLEFEKYIVDEAEDGKIGLEMALKGYYDVVLSDIKMPRLDGNELLSKLLASSINSSLIMMSGHGSIETALDCVKKGAFDYLAKPIDLNRLLVSIRNALVKTNLVAETKSLKNKIAKSYVMIGESKALNEVRELIEKVAPTEARVLITGSNGSGKELVAREIHKKSSRANAPLIEVNCAAIPSELIESELFGHEKGSFTNAIATRKGKFELAEGGTIFLDEIGDMSLSAQSKVLRALQENKIYRVGSSKEIEINVRVVAATNKDLLKEIQIGGFREDLYHRLSVIPIHVPSLNERKEDIPILAEHFINLICHDYGMATKSITSDAIKILQEKNWTGNIRELRNIIERLIILCGNEISDEDVKQYI
jgi:two-component system nitrogen regulation response regulator NtrX